MSELIFKLYKKQKYHYNLLSTFALTKFTWTNKSITSLIFVISSHYDIEELKECTRD